MSYARGGKASNKQVKSFMSDMEEIASVPGGIEMLFSQASGKGKAPGTKQLRLYNMGGPVEYAEGGLHAAAEMTREGGRGGDEVLLHVSPEEYEALVGMWGEPDINPDTGLPEYGFLSKVWKKIKKVVKKVVKSPLFSFLAPMALNVFAPGLGAAIGKSLGFAGKTAATIGNTAIKAGIGAASAGKEGALSGVVSGLTGAGVGKDIGSKLGISDKFAKIAGDAAIGGVGAEIGGGGFAQGALGNVMNSMQQDALKPLTEKIEGSARNIFGLGTPGIGDMQTGEMSPLPDGPQMSPVPSTGELTGFGDPQGPGFLSRAGSWIKDNPLLAAGAGAALYGATRGGGETASGPPTLPDSFNEGIPQFDFTRNRAQIDPNAYYTYGQVGADQQGEATFFDNNNIAGTPSAGGGSGGPLVRNDLTDDQARFMGMDLSGGGMYTSMLRRLQEQQQAQLDQNAAQPTVPTAPPVASINPDQLQAMLAQLRSQSGAQFQGGGYAEGAGSGRDDTIEALLSDGEYVMDAETVAMLGDGSNKAGAKRLDELREKLRKHKGENLRKGKFSHDAKRPEEYLAFKEGGKVTKRDIHQIADEVMNKHVKAEKPAGHAVKKGIKAERLRKKKGGAIRRRKLVRKMAAQAALGDK